MTFSTLRTLKRALTAAMFLALAAPLALPVFVALPAAAQSASAKASVDAAKAKGLVGEQGDGFIGFVSPSTDPALAAAVAEINAGRSAVYRDTASRTGVSPEAAGQATGQQLFERLPAGQFFKPLNGSWVRK
jgi:uncharacterized protein YdbL (DUF1318 family)